MRRPAACSAPTLGDSPLSDGPRPARPCDAGRGGTLGIPAGCNWFLKEEVATLQKELAALVLDMGESDDNRSDAESCCSVITLPAPAADDPPGSDREDLAGCGASSVGCESLFDATEDEMLLAPAWPWPPEASLAELIVESGSEAQVGAGLVLAEAARINALTSKNPCTRALIAHLSDASTADPAVGDLAADCEPADGDDSRSIASTVAFDCVGYTHQAESEIATTLSNEKVISAVMMALPLSDWSAVARICKSVAVRVTTNAAPVDLPCSARLARPCDAGPRSADVGAVEDLASWLEATVEQAGYRPLGAALAGSVAIADARTALHIARCLARTGTLDASDCAALLRDSRLRLISVLEAADSGVALPG